MCTPPPHSGPTRCDGKLQPWIPGDWFSLQHRLRDINANATSIGMCLNAKKTMLMMFNFTKNRQCLPFCALTDGGPLPVVAESRLLGVLLDDKLSWWPFVHDVILCARAKVWTLWS